MYFLCQFRDQGQASLRIRHNLMPRTLEIAFKSFQISNFSGGACPQTPLAKGALWPLVNTVAYSTQTCCLLQNLLKPLHTMVLRNINSFFLCSNLNAKLSISTRTCTKSSLSDYWNTSHFYNI